MGNTDPILASSRLADRDTSWMSRGLCLKFDPEAWFPKPPTNGQEDPRYDQQVRDAQGICAMCPVSQQCYDDAESRGERHGIWGGVDFARLRKAYKAKAAA